MNTGSSSPGNCINRTVTSWPWNFTSFDSKPTLEKINTFLPETAARTNSPASLVIVALAVPFSATVAPITGSFFSLITLPLISTASFLGLSSVGVSTPSAFEISWTLLLISIVLPLILYSRSGWLLKQISNTLLTVAFLTWMFIRLAFTTMGSSY